MKYLAKQSTTSPVYRYRPTQGYSIEHHSACSPDEWAKWHAGFILSPRRGRGGSHTEEAEAQRQFNEADFKYTMKANQLPLIRHYKN